MVSNIPNPIHLWWVRKQVPAESDVPSPGFEDVPAGHANAGDIDCIAYYGIAKGTGDATAYSPSMSVHLPTDSFPPLRRPLTRSKTLPSSGLGCAPVTN